MKYLRTNHTQMIQIILCSLIESAQHINSTGTSIWICTHKLNCNAVHMKSYRCKYATHSMQNMRIIMCPLCFRMRSSNVLQSFSMLSLCEFISIDVKQEQCRMFSFDFIQRAQSPGRNNTNARTKKWPVVI